jgi:predicted ATP-grasp superfamily ATP-dependent carboligase
MAETFAIVGASVRSAAQAALRAGLNIVTADLYADADLARQVDATRIADYPKGFSPWLKEAGVSAWMYTGALENYPQLVDEMGSVAPLLGNSGKALRAVRSPWRLARCLREAGLHYPDVERSSRGLPIDGSWLRKPLRGSNGAGIEPWTGHSMPHSRRTYWQHRVEGTTCAALFVAASGDAKLLGVTRQLVGTERTGAKPFQYAGSIGPWPTTQKQLAQIERIGQALAGAFGLLGLFGVDLMIDADTVWSIEVNPRYTAAAEVVERFSGVNPIAVHVKASNNSELLAPSRSTSICCGKAILYAKADFTATQNLFDWAIGKSGATLAASLGDIPHVGTPLRTGQPVLTVLADGDSPGMVELKLHAKIEEVEALIRERREG